MSEGRLATTLPLMDPAFLTATTNRLSTGVFSTSPEFKGDRKTKRKQELVEQIAALSAGADDKEEVLRNDIEDVELKLEGVFSAKRRIKQESKYVADTLRHKKDLLVSSIQKLQQQYDSLETAQMSIELGLDTDQCEKLTAFKAALLPLEEVGQSIISEKERLTRYTEQFNEKLSPLQESLAMTKEEIRSRIVESEFALHSRKEFEDQLNTFKADHEEELADFLEEIETRDMLKSIRKRKAEQAEKVRRVEKKINDNEKMLLEMQHLVTKATRELNAPQAKVDTKEELNRLETYLFRKIEELKMPQMMTIVASINNDLGYNITDAIAREQLDQLDKRELQLMEAWREEVVSLEEELVNIMARVDMDEKTLMTNKALGKVTPADIILEKTLKDNKAKVAAMEKSIDEIRIKHKLKEDALNEWKTKKRIFMSEKFPDRTLPATDSEIHAAFAKEVASRTSDADLQTSLSNILTLYSQQLQENSDKAGMRDERQRKRRADVEELATKLHSAEFLRSSLASERSAYQRELNKLLSTEKAVSRRFELMKMKTESSQKKTHEDILNTELGSRAEELSSLLKTMGNKMVQKLAERTKQEIAKQVAEKQKEVRNDLEVKYYQYQTWDKRAHRHSEAIEEELRPQYQLLADSINSLKGEAERLRDQLRAVQEAERELHTKTEGIVEGKKKELRMSMNYAARAQQAHVKTKKTEAVKVQLQSKIGRLEELEKEIEEQETTSHSKLSEIMLEEAQLKTKLSQLQNQMVEVGGDRQQIRNLEKKLKALERHRDEIHAESQALSRRPMTILGETASIIRPASRAQSVPEHDVSWSTERTRDQPQVIHPMEEDLMQPGEGELNEEQPQVEEAQGPEEKQEEPQEGEPRPPFVIRMSECTKAESEFFRVITPLLEGMQLYKKLAVKGSAKPPEFDPLEGPGPEACGYGLREMKLGKALTKIEVRQRGKPGVDLAIMLSHLLEPIVPQVTVAVIAGLKKNAGSTEPVDDATRAKYLEMKEEGIVNYSSPVILAMSRSVALFPFAMPLNKGGRVELIAQSYEDFKTWTEGIRALLKMSKELHRLKYKVE